MTLDEHVMMGKDETVRPCGHCPYADMCKPLDFWTASATTYAACLEAGFWQMCTTETQGDGYTRRDVDTTRLRGLMFAVQPEVRDLLLAGICDGENTYHKAFAKAVRDRWADCGRELKKYRSHIAN